MVFYLRSLISNLVSLAIILFCMPTAIPVTPTTMNYASVVFMGFASISVFWYIVRGRKSFTGPPVPTDVEREDQGQVVGGMGRVVTEHDETSHGSLEKKSNGDVPK